MAEAAKTAASSTTTDVKSSNRNLVYRAYLYAWWWGRSVTSWSTVVQLGSREIVCPRPVLIHSGLPAQVLRLARSEVIQLASPETVVSWVSYLHDDADLLRADVCDLDVQKSDTVRVRTRFFVPRVNLHAGVHAPASKLVAVMCGGS